LNSSREGTGVVHTVFNNVIQIDVGLTKFKYNMDQSDEKNSDSRNVALDSDNCKQYRKYIERQEQN